MNVTNSQDKKKHKKRAHSFLELSVFKIQNGMQIDKDVRETANAEVLNGASTSAFTS